MEGTQVLSLASVLTVNTPLTPSESHENGSEGLRYPF